jgi:hypothetical protein
MLNLSTFGYTVDIYTIIHFIPHACRYAMVTRAITAVILLLPSGKPRQLTHGLSLKKYMSFSLYWRKNYHDPLRSLLVAIFLMFHGLMNTPVQSNDFIMTT